MADTNPFRSSTNHPPQPADGTNSTDDGLEETLGRLSKKAGVKATIVLDRATGAILKTSGEISQIRISKGAGEKSESSPFSSEPTTTTGNETNQGAEQLAAMVWSFVSAAGVLVQDLDVEDELRLLRLRTRKQELVIVPDPKYLLIVIHDTPAA